MEIVKVTKDWQKLSDIAQLTAGKDYQIENVGGGTLCLFQGDNEPSEEKGFLIDQNKFFGYTYDTELYVKGVDAVTEIAITEGE